MEVGKFVLIKFLSAKAEKAEERAERLDKRIDLIEGRLEASDPALRGLMREGLPLEVEVRLRLQKDNFTVHGEFHFVYFARDGVVERSVDVYADVSATVRFPATEHRKVEERREHTHLLVEAKQRRAGVQWVFVDLPSDSRRGYLDPPAPLVTTGFELRFGKESQDGKNNAEGTENGIAQLSQAEVPLRARIDAYRGRSKADPVARLMRPSEHDYVHLLLVTNAAISVFQPPAEFAQLDDDQLRGQFLKPVHWVICRPEPSLSLRLHCETWLVNAGLGADSVTSEPIIHVVDLEGMAACLRYVRNQRRLNGITPERVEDPRPIPEAGTVILSSRQSLYTASEQELFGRKLR